MEICARFVRFCAICLAMCSFFCTFAADFKEIVREVIHYYNNILWL